MLSGLDDYDWKQAFGYAGEPDTDARQINIDPALPNQIISLEPFTREDVSEIIAMFEGEHDGQNWICVGKLKDGRYFFLSAGCDYTGWD